MKSNNKTIQIFAAAIVLVAVIGITVGFATMSRALAINGTTTVEPANWSVHFTNLRSTELTGSAAEVKTPTLTEKDTHMGDYEVKLSKPGDKAVYYVDVVNDGDLNAELTSVSIATPTITASNNETKDKDEQVVRSNLVYTVTYADGTPIVEGDTLTAENGKSTIKVVIEYNPAATELPTGDVTITGMDVDLIYSQK